MSSPFVPEVHEYHNYRLVHEESYATRERNECRMGEDRMQGLRDRVNDHAY